MLRSFAELVHNIAKNGIQELKLEYVIFVLTTPKNEENLFWDSVYCRTVCFALNYTLKLKKD